MYEIVIPVTRGDVATLLLNIPFIRRNLSPSRIIIMGASDLRKLVEIDDRLLFIDEDLLIGDLTLSRIQLILIERTGSSIRAGWYFQQFLKMAYSKVCSDRFYVVWDSDTIPLTPINFFDSIGRMYLTIKDEFNKPYFDTLFRILGLKRTIEKSFIAEGMVIDSNIMVNLINEIEGNGELPGVTFYEKIISAISDSVLMGSGFSEFETYGNFLVNKYPCRYVLRELKSLRQAGSFFYDNPTISSLRWISRDFDTVSFEKWSQKKKWMRISNNPVIHCVFSFYFYCYLVRIISAILLRVNAGFYRIKAFIF